MTPEILTAVVVAILSSKLWDFLAARFKRKDEVEDKVCGVSEVSAWQI